MEQNLLQISKSSTFHMHCTYRTSKRGHFFRCLGIPYSNASMPCCLLYQQFCHASVIMPRQSSYLRRSIILVFSACLSCLVFNSFNHGIYQKCCYQSTAMRIFPGPGPELLRIIFDVSKVTYRGENMFSLRLFQYSVAIEMEVHYNKLGGGTLPIC